MDTSYKPITSFDQLPFHVQASIDSRLLKEILFAVYYVENYNHGTPGTISYQAIKELADIAVKLQNVITWNEVNILHLEDRLELYRRHFGELPAQAVDFRNIRNPETTRVDDLNVAVTEEQQRSIHDLYKVDLAKPGEDVTVFRRIYDDIPRAGYIEFDRQFDLKNKLSGAEIRVNRVEYLPVEGETPDQEQDDDHLVDDVR